MEQEEYRAENISWQYVQFPDNQPIIDLIAGKPNGIMHLCNDEASLVTVSPRSIQSFTKLLVEIFTIFNFPNQLIKQKICLFFEVLAYHSFLCTKILHN